MHDLFGSPAGRYCLIEAEQRVEGAFSLGSSARYLMNAGAPAPWLQECFRPLSGLANSPFCKASRHVTADDDENVSGRAFPAGLSFLRTQALKLPV